MGNKIVTLITTFVAMMIFILLVAFISTDSQIKESQRLVKEFTETVQYKGCITYEQYTSLIDKIPFSNIKVQLTHIMDNDDTDPGVQDMRFTSQILTGQGYMSSDTKRGFELGVNESGDKTYTGYLLNNSYGSDDDKGIYKMNIGDQIIVELIVMDGTFFNSIVSGITGANTASMQSIASYSGAILNTRYE